MDYSKIIINKLEKNRGKIYSYVILLVIIYGLIFLLVSIPSLIKEKYFSHETRVKIIIKSIDYIKKIYIESTPNEKSEIEHSLKNLSETINQDNKTECKK